MRKRDGRKPDRDTPARVLSAASVGSGNTLRPQPRSDVTPSKAQAGEETGLRAKTRRGHRQEAQRGPGQRRGGNGMEEESQGVCRPPPTPTTALPATSPAAGSPEQQVALAFLSEEAACSRLSEGLTPVLRALGPSGTRRLEAGPRARHCVSGAVCA